LFESVTSVQLRVFVFCGTAPDFEEAIAIGEDADRGVLLQDAHLGAIRVRGAGAAGHAFGLVAGNIDDFARKGQRPGSLDDGLLRQHRHCEDTRQPGSKHHLTHTARLYACPRAV
jgi:hypothetical protein